MAQRKREKMQAIEASVFRSAAAFFGEFNLGSSEKFESFLEKVHNLQFVSPHAGEEEGKLHEPETELRKRFYELIDGMDLEQLTTAFSAAQDVLASVPDVAPMLWKDRDKGNGQNCIDFVREVYGPWIGKGLKRSHLQVLDGTLYRTLATYISRNGVPDDLLPMETPKQAKAPDKGEITEETLTNLGIGKPADAFKVFEDNRVQAQRYYRAAQRILGP